MAKDRMFGKGAVLEVENGTGTGTYLTLGLLTEYQLAPDESPSVDLTGLEDPAYVGGVGIPEESSLNFTHIWDADVFTPEDDRADALLDQFWQTSELILFRITETDGVVTMQETIGGRVQRLVPTQVTATEGKRREVTVLRDGTVPRTRVRNPVRT